MAAIATADTGLLDLWNAQLDRAHRLPLYRDRLPAAGLDRIEQVADLPFTTKDDFRRHYPFAMLTVPTEQVVRLHLSSGTTGRPVVTGYTRDDLDRRAACLERRLR